MADTIAIRRQIRSVTSTRQITKAMQLVAASKMRAATAAAERSASFRDLTERMIKEAAASPDWSLHPLAVPSESKTTRIIIIGSDRGLAGPYHTRLEAELRRAVSVEQREGSQIELTTIGRKASLMANRVASIEVSERHPGFNTLPTMWEIHSLGTYLIRAYQEGHLGKVIIISQRFLSPLRQEAIARELLPLTAIEPEAALPPVLEPEADVAITGVIQTWLQAQLFDAAASAMASEQAMRMLAMQNATDNAGDMIDELTLAYNTARQAAITQELAEISGGVAALEG